MIRSLGMLYQRTLNCATDGAINPTMTEGSDGFAHPQYDYVDFYFCLTTKVIYSFIPHDHVTV